MAKSFKIAQNATFKKVVSIPRVGGDAIEVEFEYKYLPRQELAKLYESWEKKAKELQISETSTLSELTEAEIDLQVGQLQDILVGWAFSDEFNEENIRALVETSVHASRVVTEVYSDAYAKAKLGN